MTIDKSHIPNSTEYQVSLDIFQGPMDLLIHLIRKNEVDIFDIPIKAITDQYLEYIDMMKALNINVAGDFLVMASTLIHIKSRMLLPEFGEGLDDEEDPRVEITRPLLEYLRLKEVAIELSERDLLDRDVFKRALSPDYAGHFQGKEPLLDVNIFQLMDAFKKVIEQALPGAPLNYEPQKWTVKEKTAYIMEQLRRDSILYFQDLFSDNRTISEFVTTFLALLELVHLGLVRVFQPEPNKDIRIEAHFKDTEDNDHEQIIQANH